MPNSSRYYLEKYNQAFAANCEPGMIVLDAGAGEQPYAKYFAHATYESADFELVDKPYARSTYVCDLADIPVDDARFDRVMFNQVMEHLPDPLTVLKELNRVMKPGAELICTAPLFYAEHEQPYDFYRYTQFGNRHLFTEAGFEVISIDWMEGYFGTVAYQLKTMSSVLPLSADVYFRAPWWPILCWPVVLFVRLWATLLAMMFSQLDQVSKVTTNGHPKNYVTQVRKPSA